MYNALSGLGAGGLASATVWNQATAILFVSTFRRFCSEAQTREAQTVTSRQTFLCVTCVFAPIVINQFELRWTLSLASASYSLYAASLYCNSKSGNTWFLILANVLNGIGAGAYYAVEGAAVTGYPEANRRGRCVLFLNLALHGPSS